MANHIQPTYFPLPGLPGSAPQPLPFPLRALPCHLAPGVPATQCADAGAAGQPAGMARADGAGGNLDRWKIPMP